jgi:SAM-dependent methyltransferase
VVYYEIHGRQYCGEYYMPIDDDEQTRMQMLHAVQLFLLNGRLTTAPLNNPTKILDVGTGCGDWAMAMGDEYPEAEVIGTDIAKIQPSAVPLNVFFEIDDAEEEGGWTYADDEFDLVHFRSMMGAFTDWNLIYKEAYKHLKPGGWIEVKDFDDHKALLQFFPPGSQVKPWLAAIAEGSKKSGRPRGIEHLEHGRLTDLGFVDVNTEEYNSPMGVWPDDPEEKKIGKLFMIAQMCGIEALCLRILTEQMGWDPAEVRRMCDIVSEDVRAVAVDAKRARGLGILVRVVKGRKPFPGEQDHDGESVSTIRNGENTQGQGEPVNGV